MTRIELTLPSKFDVLYKAYTLQLSKKEKKKRGEKVMK